MLNVGKFILFLTAFILLVSLCFSCQTTQKQSFKGTILQIDFYVRYLQSDKQVKAEISFSEVDSTKKIVPKMMEEVLFQDMALDGKKVLNQYRYQITETAPFLENYSFGYRLAGQDLKEEEITMRPTIDFIIKEGKVSKRVGTTITFQDNGLHNTEKLVLLIGDKNGKTATLKVDNLSENTTINLLPEKVKNLEIGKGTIYVVRKQVVEEEGENVQITGLTEYYSEVKNIEIID